MKEPPYRVKNMMPGMIMLWAGAIVDIPSGWHLCDGTVGTPDLRNRFIVAAGDTYNPGDNHADPQHAHDFTGDGHVHFIIGPQLIQIGTPFPVDIQSTAVTGTTDTEGAVPPYYALCYIMKL